MVREEPKERRCEECFHYGACRRLIDGEKEDLLPCCLFLPKVKLFCLVRPCEKCRWWSEPISDELLEACAVCERYEIREFDLKGLCEYYDIEAFATKKEAEEAKRKRERRAEDQACDGAGDA